MLKFRDDLNLLTFERTRHLVIKKFSLSLCSTFDVVVTRQSALTVSCPVMLFLFSFPKTRKHDARSYFSSRYDDDFLPFSRYIPTVMYLCDSHLLNKPPSHKMMAFFFFKWKIFLLLMFLQSFRHFSFEYRERKGKQPEEEKKICHQPRWKTSD